MPRPDELRFDLTATGQSLLLALLFLLLAAVPARLASKALRENQAAISGWVSLGWPRGSWRRRLAGFSNNRVGMALVVILSAVAYGFLSPSFGLDAESVAAFVGILAGLVIGSVIFELPLILTHRWVANDRGRLRMLPLAIVIALAAVLLSRVAGFQPGYLYGFVAGWAFDSINWRDEARAQALTGVWMLLVALAAWLALALVEGVLSSQPLLDMAVGAGLATIFVGGLEGLLLELVPLPFLRGAKVFAWRRTVWAALFLAAAFCFAYILLNPATGFLGSTRVSPLIPAVILFASFGIASVLFWAYFRFRRPA